MTLRRVSVDVATVWVDPSSPRQIDRPAVITPPDHATWSKLDAESRFGLHERTETQVLQGEPVEVLGQLDGWTQIAAPWQPSPKDPRGYPGWVRTDHLEDAGNNGGPGQPVATVAADHVDIFESRPDVCRCPVPLGWHQPVGLRLLRRGALLLPAGWNRHTA